MGYKEHLYEYENDFYLGIINQVVEKVLGDINFLKYEWNLNESYIDENNELNRKFKEINYRIFSDNFVLAVSLFDEEEKIIKY